MNRGSNVILSKPKRLESQENNLDRVGLSSFAVKNRTRGLQRLTIDRGSNYFDGTKVSVPIQTSTLLVNNLKPAMTEQMKKEKNQVLISMNCSKALPLEGYQNICDLMKPYKGKLRERGQSKPHLT